MVNAFRAEAQKQNFAGLLIDFDHFSLDEKLKSEAAGWITALEARFSGQLAGGSEGSGQTADLGNIATKNAQNTKLVDSGADGLREGDSRRGAESAEEDAQE